jgi:protein-L-isoaspartate(D-aspartate) O-methyltransferase
MSWQDILEEDDYRFYKENISLMEDQVVQRFKENYRDPSILAAMRNVPRHLFVHAGYKKLAYTDYAFPTYNGMTTSAPSVIAEMIYHSGVKRGDKLLEIGTGTGCQAAVLSEMGVKVFSIEIDKKIIQAANQILIKLGYKIDEQLKDKDKIYRMRKRYHEIKAQFPMRGSIKLYYGNGQLGLQKHAPFKAIIIAASLSHPRALNDLVPQLSAHQGRLIVPIGDRREQQMYIVEKKNKKLKTLIIQGICFQFVRMVLRASSSH